MSCPRKWAEPPGLLCNVEYRNAEWTGSCRCSEYQPGARRKYREAESDSIFFRAVRRFAYRTMRIVRIQDRYLGLMYYSICLLVRHGLAFHALLANVLALGLNALQQTSFFRN